jgi:hypothetical protein
MLTNKCDQLLKDELKLVHEAIVGHQGGTRSKPLLIENILDNAKSVEQVLRVLAKRKLQEPESSSEEEEDSESEEEDESESDDSSDTTRSDLVSASQPKEKEFLMELLDKLLNKEQAKDMHENVIGNRGGSRPKSSLIEAILDNSQSTNQVLSWFTVSQLKDYIKIFHDKAPGKRSKDDLIELLLKLETQV